MHWMGTITQPIMHAAGHQYATNLSCGLKALHDAQISAPVSASASVPLAVGGGSAQDRWLAAQQRVQLEHAVRGPNGSGIGVATDAPDAQAAPANAAGTGSAIDSLQAAPTNISTVAAAASVDAPGPYVAQPGDITEHQTDQAEIGTELQAAAAPDVQGTVPKKWEEDGPTSLGEAAPGSIEPLTNEEQRQQLANAAALTRVANMEAIRKAISVSVASASNGELPAASVDCAKVVSLARGQLEHGSVCTGLTHCHDAPFGCSGVCLQHTSRWHCKAQACRYGEAPGYWRIKSPGRRQWALYDDACELADLLLLHLQVWTRMRRETSAAP
jgi:hypothetical protein